MWVDRFDPGEDCSAERVPSMGLTRVRIAQWSECHCGLIAGFDHRYIYGLTQVRIAQWRECVDPGMEAPIALGKSLG